MHNRPFEEFNETRDCPECKGFGGKNVKSERGNKYRKTCDNCQGCGQISLGSNYRELTDSEWISRLQDRLDRMEEILNSIAKADGV